MKCEAHVPCLGLIWCNLCFFVILYFQLKPDEEKNLNDVSIIEHESKSRIQNWCPLCSLSTNWAQAKKKMTNPKGSVCIFSHRDKSIINNSLRNYLFLRKSHCFAINIASYFMSTTLLIKKNYIVYNDSLAQMLPI